MTRVLITYAGGALGIGFARSLQAAPEEFHVIGVDSDRFKLCRAPVEERHLVPRASEADYLPVLRSIIEDTGAEVLCPQLPAEICMVSRDRDALGAATFLPRHETIELCEDKHASQVVWERTGLPVPRTMLIESATDLGFAFRELGPRLWLRATRGSGGKGSLPVSDYEQATAWINMHQGWGQTTAAECLEPQSITWQSIWRDGELVAAQARKRLYWEFSSVSASGVTGVTGTGETLGDPGLDETAIAAVRAIDPRPHGVFSVDLTYDGRGTPNLTEINCGRFFTTHHFFTQAGLNMPHMYVKLALGQEPPQTEQVLNPLPDGLLWVRGMGVEPVLTHRNEVDEAVESLRGRLTAIGR